MKALSLWQPWASAIALGAKRVETRSWETLYRGPLLIHAAKRRPVYELLALNSNWTWLAVLRPLGKRMGDNLRIEERLQFGALIAVADLVACRRTNSFTVEELDTRRFADGETHELESWTERMMGDFSPGRFGWVLENIRPLAEPIPYRGAQGLFDVPASVLEREAVTA